MLTLLIIFLLMSFMASTFIITAMMVSSRSEHEEPVMENDEPVFASKTSEKIIPQTYSIEI